MSETSESVFSLSERYVVGSVYLSLACIILLIHLSILYIFLKIPDYRNSETYRIMLSIGAADCLQLITHTYTGLITITHDSFNQNLEKFLGGLANASWLAMIPQTLILSINRLLVFRNTNNNKNKNNFLYIFGLFLCWLFGLSFFILYMTNYTGLIYDNENFYWSYDNGNWSNIVGIVEYYTSIPILCCTFIVYVIIVITIVIMRNSLTSNKQLLSKSELKLLIQSFIIFLYTVVLICCWHYYMYFLPDSKWTSATINMFWILFGLLNPFLYLTMNPTIRSRFLELFTVKNRSNRNPKISIISSKAPTLSNV